MSETDGWKQSAGKSPLFTKQTSEPVSTKASRVREVVPPVTRTESTRLTSRMSPVNTALAERWRNFCRSCCSAVRFSRKIWAGSEPANGTAVDAQLPRGTAVACDKPPPSPSSGKGVVQVSPCNSYGGANRPLCSPKPKKTTLFLARLNAQVGYLYNGMVGL